MHILSSAMESLKGENLNQILLKAKDDLEFADLSFIPNREVNDETLGALAHCKKLTGLILTGSTHVGDSGLHKLGSGGMPRLKTLKLGGLTGVSDSGVNSVVSMAPHLQLLELNNIERISDSSLESITKVDCIIIILSDSSLPTSTLCY
jgi:hypothetical protein